jgi:hypothetical protein
MTFVKCESAKTSIGNDYVRGRQYAFTEPLDAKGTNVRRSFAVVDHGKIEMLAIEGVGELRPTARSASLNDLCYELFSPHISLKDTIKRIDRVASVFGVVVSKVGDRDEAILQLNSDWKRTV